MINPLLHREPVALDGTQHRELTLDPTVTDWSVAQRLNSIFVAAAEFADTARDFPIVFVPAGKDAEGRDQVAPIAVLGVVAEQNLYVEGGQWVGRYIPAVLRAYPFCIGRIDADNTAVCLDLAAKGVNAAGGQRLFDAAGAPTVMLQGMQKHMELIQTEVERTRLVCRRLMELELLRDMRFDATLPGGRQHTLDGFLTIDQEKAQQLPDATVGELHRSGMLGLIHMHWLSLGNMQRLLERHVARAGAAAAGAA